MADQLDMTISEAEGILGVKAGSSRDDVQSAYRAIARKYHPDKWLNKPDSERKRATKIYERANTAKKILLNPSLAKEEPTASEDDANGGIRIPQTTTGGTITGGSSSPDAYRGGYGSNTPSYHDGYVSNAVSHQPSYGTSDDMYSHGSVRTERFGQPPTRRVNGVRNGGNVTKNRVTMGNPRPSGVRRPDFNSPSHTYDNDNAPNDATSSWARVGNSESEREKFNTAKSFEDRFGKVKDAEEAEYAKEYAVLTRSRYHKASDVLHWTSSAVATLMAFLVALYVVMENGVMSSLGQSAVNGTLASNAGGIDWVPFVSVTIACLVKLLLYDMMIASSFGRPLDDSNGFMHGIPFMIGGVAIALFGYTQMHSMLFIWLLVAFVAIGIIMCVVHGIRHPTERSE